LRLLGRRGFTLAELLVALVLFATVTAGTYKVLLINQRVYQAQTQHIDLQQNLRAGGAVFDGEFHELDATDGDIQAMSANSITIRAMRQLGFICSAPVLGGGLTGLTMTVRNTPFFSLRAFSTTSDSLLIFYEGNAASRTDDGWHSARLTATQNQNCPAPDNAPGQQLTMNLTAFVAPQLNSAGMMTIGSPVRGFEIVTYKAYQGPDSKWYVGLQSASGTQPILGPILGSTGLAFTYYDAAGAVTAVAANVARISVTLRAQTAQLVQQGGGSGGLVAPVDSITTQVSLRNNPRF
jgi:prepilin-type N-terminal cleavage/methylation domain-containing protein